MTATKRSNFQLTKMIRRQEVDIKLGNISLDFIAFYIHVLNLYMQMFLKM